jgi:hypothetical protein
MFLNNKVFELNLKQKVHCFFKLLTLLTVLGKVTNPVVFGHEGMSVKLSVLSSFQHVNCFQTQWIYLLPHQKSNSRLMAIGIKLPNYDYWWLVIFLSAAFSFFQSTEEDTRSEAQKSEDEIIMLLKKAKVRLQPPVTTATLSPTTTPRYASCHR